MKIYKYLHSCVVFEEEGFKLLVDPGIYSFVEGRVKASDFKDVSAVIITHNHPDHLDKENLKTILQLSGAKLYTNGQVADELKELDIDTELLTDGDFQIGPFSIKTLSVVHQPLLDAPVPQMTALVIDDKVLHPVDSFEQNLQRYQGIEMLLLPIMAPFTDEISVAAFADKLQPKQIIAVHDGFAKEFF